MTQPTTTVRFAERAPNCPLCDGKIAHWSSKVRRGQNYEYDRCPACGFVFVNPRPTLEYLSEYYSAQSAGSPRTPAENAPEASAEIHDPGDIATQTIASLKFLRPTGGRFLDVGAGGGPFSRAAINAGLDVTALELDPTDIQSLRSIPGVKVIPTLFEQLQLPPESFDYILMSHVLEHAYDPAGWISKAATLLSHGGVLAIMLPHLDSIYRRLGGVRDPYFIPPEHLNHFNRQSLSRLCARFGLRQARAHTEGKFKDNVITKRVKLPQVLKPVVRVATAAASNLVLLATRSTNTGAVLVFHAIKE
jgi:2-polyprenyl-3-methyl-5-hydroxy-6-metoxy-1,4-benzoquinol methylase